jgi:hypothetical protein
MALPGGAALPQLTQDSKKPQPFDRGILLRLAEKYKREPTG